MACTGSTLAVNLKIIFKYYSRAVWGVSESNYMLNTRSRYTLICYVWSLIVVIFFLQYLLLFTQSRVNTYSIYYNQPLTINYRPIRHDTIDDDDDDDNAGSDREIQSDIE